MEQNTASGTIETPKKLGGYRPGSGAKKKVTSPTAKGVGIGIYVPKDKVQFVRSLIAQLKKEWMLQEESEL